jgi:integrase
MQDAPVPRALTVGELADRYLIHAEKYYRDVDGKPTKEHLNYHTALVHWFLYSIERDLPVKHLTKNDLRICQDAMVTCQLSRRYISAVMRRIRAAFAWAITEDLIEDTDDDMTATRMLGLFAAVPKLKAHRSNAREPEPIKPVDVKHVLATLKYLKGSARNVVELILRTGARSQEIASLRYCDVIYGGRDVGWYAQPRKHKNTWRGHTRQIPLDEACMQIVDRCLPADELFETGEMNDAPIFPSRDKKAFTSSGLRSAMMAAIKRANAAGENVPQWHLHQARHTVAQLARQLSTLDDTQALLGHRSRGMTEHYTGRDQHKGARRAQRRVSKAVAAAKGACA